MNFGKGRNGIEAVKKQTVRREKRREVEEKERQKRNGGEEEMAPVSTQEENLSSASRHCARNRPSCSFGSGLCDCCLVYFSPCREEGRLPLAEHLGRSCDLHSDPQCLFHLQHPRYLALGH
ncbi:unnamed protein product [Lepidochelys olivacea]